MRSYYEIMKDVKNPPPKQIDITKVISEQMQLPISIVKKGIKQGQLTINFKPVFLSEIQLKPNTVIKFQGIIVDTSSFEKLNEFDVFVDMILKELGILDLSNLKASLRKPFCSYLISYFANNHLEQVVDSGTQYLDIVVNELEALYKDSFKDSKDTKIPRRKELIEKLVTLRTENFNELSGLVTNLTDGFFSGSLYKFLQEYTRVINKNSFQNIFAPILPNSLYSRLAIDSLIKPITEASTKLEIEDKFKHFDVNKNLYSSYLNLIDKSNTLHLKVFKEIGEYLFNLFKKACDASDVKSADVMIASTARKYNFSNQDRTDYDLFLNVSNVGDGLARDVVLYSQSDTFQFEQYSVGILKPSESREISINSILIKPVDSPSLSVKCSWIDVSGTSKEKVLNIVFGVQNINIPWDILEKKKPYTIQEIEEREKLFGRDEILKELEQNILSDKIESYKIWGQKRVGKSSIVKTLKSLFNERENIIVVWRSIAGLKNTEALLTLNTLGESICSEIFEEIDRKLTSHGIKQSLRSVPVPEFNGSLFPLENYIKKLKKIEDSLCFIFIIDEFDRINEEFFLPGNLGDSFSLNIGKGINSLSYVGFILVGSENMHLLDRQEINYNSFQNREVDTFDKKREFESFKKIITGPVTPHIHYSDEAIEKIYDVTNGNPYFANLICSNVFNFCLKLKDNEVDINTVHKAIGLIVDSYQKSHFEHFWADGITEDSNVKKERKADIRRRILVSYSFCFFLTKEFPTKSEVIRNFKKPLEYEVELYEIDNAITEYYNRKIFFDDNNAIRIKPEIFELWLCGPGRTLMIEGISDLEALQREKQLEAEHALKNEELIRLSESFKFKGQRLKVSELVNYFNQFGGPFEQRRIFTLLDNINYTSKDDFIEFIKNEQKNIFRKSELSIKSNAKSPYREDVEIYSFPDTINENHEIFETFKLLSLIRKTKTLKSIVNNKDAWKNSGADDIIIFESVIDDFALIQSELLSLFDEKLVQDNIPVKLISLIITSRAKADLIKAMSPYSNFKLIHFKEIEESKIKPFIVTTDVYETNEEASFAFAEIRRHCHETSKESLNVLFETHCPGKSIPIYWQKANHFVPIFPNPVGVLYKEVRTQDNEAYRDRVYLAAKEFIQTVNPFLINYLRNKAKSDGFSGDENWFRSDYIPPSCIKSITDKWLSESCKNPKETYFDLIEYKEVIKKHKELMPIFQIHDKTGGNGLDWIDTINETRRTAAHQEKHPPSLQQTEYFEQKKDEVLKRIISFKNQSS